MAAAVVAGAAACRCLPSKTRLSAAAECPGYANRHVSRGWAALRHKQLAKIAALDFENTVGTQVGSKGEQNVGLRLLSIYLSLLGSVHAGPSYVDWRVVHTDTQD
jgi:hypothetical protein